MFVNAVALPGNVDVVWGGGDDYTGLTAPPRQLHRATVGAPRHPGLRRTHE